MPAPAVADGLYRDPVSGSVVHVKGGMVLLERDGKVYQAPPAEAGQKILTEAYKPATGQSIQAYREANAPTDVAGALGTAAEHVATGIYGGATAIPRGLGAMAETLAREAGAPMSGPGVKALGEESLAGAVGGKQYAAERAQRAAEHPGMALLGELAGQTVGAAGLPLASAGEAAGVDAKVAGGALEGAGFGATAATEEAYAHNTDLTGEKLIAAMGPMALLGGGAALLGAGASRLFSRTESRGATALDSPRLTTETAEAGSVGLRKMLAGYAEERTAKAIGLRGISGFKKLGRTGEAVEENMRRMTRDVLEARLDSGERVFQALDSQDALLGKLKQAETEAADRLATFRKRVWSHAEENGYRKPGNVLAPDMDAFYKKMEAEVVAPLASSSVKDVQAKAGIVQNALQEIRDLGENPTLEQLTKHRQDLASVIYPKPSAPGMPSLPPIGALELQGVERGLEHLIESTTDKMAATMPGVKAGEYVSLKTKLRSMIQARQIAEKADVQDLANRAIQPSDYGAAVGGEVLGVLGGGPLGGAIGGIASAMAHKTIREHGSAVLAVLADRLSKNLDGRIDVAIGRAIGQTGARVAEIGGRAVEVAGKAPRIAQTATVAAFSRGDASRETYAKRVKEVVAANDPVRSTSRLAGSLGALHSAQPAMGLAATTTATRAAQYLASKIPAGTMTPSIFHASPDSQVNDEDLHRFSVAWETVNNPLSILDDLQNGMLTQGQVDAVKAVYPQLFQQIQERTREALLKLKEPPPYATRAQLDLLLDLNGAGEPSLSPAFQATLQDAAKQVAQSQQQPQRPPRGPAPNMAARAKTLGDTIEAGT